MNLQSVYDISQPPSFDDDGYILAPNFLSDSELIKVERTFFALLQMQAYKMGINYEMYGITNIPHKELVEETSNLVTQVSEKSKYAIDSAVQMLREMVPVQGLLSEKNIQLISQILDEPSYLVKIHYDGILINLPGNETRLYTYHSESAYYPFRQNFINFWAPVFCDKTSTNGTMRLRPKGHTRGYHFNEFSGFSTREAPSVSESKFLHQLDIPDKDLEGLDVAVCDLKRGDALFFHAKMPHTSTINHSSKPSFALVMRAYSFTQDLTLSDNNGIKPYTQSAAAGGYPGLRRLPKNLFTEEG